MRWRNFHIWRKRLPHWRADDVTYFVTFRSQRPLDEQERDRLRNALLRPDGQKWDVDILVVLPERTEMLIRVRAGKGGEPIELSDIVEKAKAKAGKAIIKKTGERFPPFYSESYDRIMRDEAEFEENWLRILGSPCDESLAEDPSEYPWLYVRSPASPDGG
jgi:hypothetical protein